MKTRKHLTPQPTATNAEFYSKINSSYFKFQHHDKDELLLTHFSVAVKKNLFISFI